MSASRLECGICLGRFTDPRLISCHHSFCYQCLEDLVRKTVNNGYFMCPLCRESVKLPWDGVSGFKKNFYIDSDCGENYANPDSGENFVCDICGPGKMACSRCLDCEENFCQSCCNVHEKSKGTRHHQICDLGTLDNNMKGKIRQRTVCHQHPKEEMRLFCRDCKVLICIVCKTGRHEKHDTKLVPDAAVEMKKILQTRLNECSHKMKRINVSKQKVEELNKSIDNAEQEEIKTVEDKHSQLNQLISREVAKVKDRITTVYHDLRQQNAVLEKYVQDELKTCSNVMNDAQELKDQGNDIDIIKKGPNLEKLISRVISSTDRTTKICLKNKLFSPADNNEKILISLIGTMEDSTDSEERKKKELEERKKKEREERVKKEIEERENKEREKREKKERDQREKKERLCTLIGVFC